MLDRILCSRHILEHGFFVGFLVFLCVCVWLFLPLVLACELDKILRFFGE